jgi:hypothetical protein
MTDPDYLRQAKAKMAAFDKLPPTARKALTDAAYTWPVEDIYDAWKDGERGFKTGRDIKRQIERWDKQRKRERAKP